MTNSAAASCVGLLLAAGAGTRMGRPKALVRGADGVPWLERSIRLLQAAGCDPVVVVLGAEADAAAQLIPAGSPGADSPGAGSRDVGSRVLPVVSARWSEGMGASLGDGMAAVTEHAPGADAIVITLVDLPGLSVEVMDRLTAGATPATLRQATFDARPGHPVVVGRDHWAGFSAVLTGDTGGRAYLSGAGVELVECGDLGDGRDVDTVEQLERTHTAPPKPRHPEPRHPEPRHP